MVEKSILIVDHNPASRSYLATFLKGKLFKVLEAPTGKEGLIVAWRDAPDLVFLILRCRISPIRISSRNCATIREPVQHCSWHFPVILRQLADKVV